MLALPSYGQNALVGLSYRNFLDGSGANGASIEYGHKYSFGWIFASVAAFDHSITISYPTSPNGPAFVLTYPKDNPPNSETMAEFQQALTNGKNNGEPSPDYKYTPLGFFGAISLSYCFQPSESFLVGPIVGIFIGKGDEIGTDPYTKEPDVIPISDLIVRANLGGCIKISLA